MSYALRRRERRAVNESKNLTTNPSAAPAPSLDQKISQSMSRLNHLSEDWFTYLDNQSIDLNIKFDKLYEITKKNSILEKSVNEWQTKTLNAITEEVGISSGDIDQRLARAQTMKDQIKSESIEVKQSLKQKKSEKTKVERNLRNISKHLDELKAEVKDNEDRDQEKEAKLLSQLFNCKYKVSSNNRVVAIDFNDRKRNQKIISIDREDVHKDFWTHINKLYKL